MAVADSSRFGPGTPGPMPRAQGRATALFSALSSGGTLGVAPFLLFALLFLVLPTLGLVSGAFFDAKGQLTLENFELLAQPVIVNAYLISIKVSAASALIPNPFNSP